MKNCIKSFSAILFDMDGVIINTRPSIEAFWHEWAQKADVLLTEELIETHIHGCPTQTTINALFNSAPEEIKRGILKSSMEIGAEAGKMVMPGFFNLIDYLDNESIPYGIVTSHTADSVSKIIDQLQLASRIKVLVTSDSVANGKPYPDPYLLGTSKLGFEAQKVLVFEDSISGCTSAISAGNRVIGINSEVGGKKLLEIGVFRVFQDFNQMMNFRIADKELLQLNS